MLPLFEKLNIIFNNSFITIISDSTPDTIRNIFIGGQYQNIFSTPAKSSIIPLWQSIITGLTSLVVCGITAWFLTRNVKKQIESSEKLLYSQASLERNNELRETLAKLLSELYKGNATYLNRYEPVSDEHILLEKKLAVMLNPGNPSEKLLLDKIKEYHIAPIANVPTWLTEIELLAHKTLT